MYWRSLRRSVALIDRRFCLRPRDDLVDHVVAESALGEKSVDLALPIGRLERLPSPELPRDRATGAVGLALCGHLPERGVDRFSSDALAAELAHQRAVAFRPKP